MAGILLYILQKFSEQPFHWTSVNNYFSREVKEFGNLSNFQISNFRNNGNVKDVYRNLTDMYDVALLQKYLTAFNRQLFLQKAQWKMFERVFSKLLDVAWDLHVIAQ